MSDSLICYVTREWAPVTPGGIGRALWAQAARAVEPSLVLLDQNSSTVLRAREECPEAVSIVGVEDLAGSTLPAHVFRSEAYWRSHRIWRALVALSSQRAIRAIEFPDFDGLGYVAIKAVRLGLGAPLPVLRVRLHGTVSRIAEGDGRPLLGLEDKQRAAMERYSIRYADRVIAPSKAVLDAYRQEYPVAAICSVEEPMIDPPCVTAAFPTEPSPLVVGFLGKVQPVKGPETLVRAVVSRLHVEGPDAIEVHLVGSDEQGRFDESHASELQRLIPERFADQFIFHGALGREAAHRRLAACHAAVVPSRSETYGLAARELAAIGLPLAVSDLPAFAEEIGGSKDWIERFPRDDHGALATILEGWSASLAAGIWPPSEAVVARGLTLPPDPPESAQGHGIGVPEEEAESRRGAEPVEARPLVSIVIPFYEMHEYVDACLASVDSDSYAEKEILLVDDGSRSPQAREKLEVLRTRFGADPRWRFVSKANGGLGSARNAGIVEASGDFVLSIDPDDLIVPGYLDAAVTAFERAPELAWVNGISGLFRDGRDPVQADDWIVPYDPDLSMLFYENGTGTAAAVFRRDVLIERPYREDIPAYEDWDLQIRLAADGLSGEVLPQVFHRYRQRRGGLAKLGHRQHDQLVVAMLAPHLEGVDPVVRSALEIYLASGARMRGLGTGRRTAASDFADWVEALYRRRLKAWMSERLGDARRDRIARQIRRILRGD